MTVSQKDKEIIRELAKRYMELALSDEQKQMNDRMQATNDLKIVRPPVLIDEIPWYQMDIDGELICQTEHPRIRHLEEYFRRAFYRRKYFRADTIFEPFYRVRKSYDSTGIGISVEEEIRRTDDINHIVSHSYTDVLEDEEALEQIQIPTFTLRPDRDAEAMEFFTDLLGDSMPVRLCGSGYLYHAPWDFIARLRGMEPILYDIYDRPDYLHRIRARFRDITIAELDFIERYVGVDNSGEELHCTPAKISGLQENTLKATWFRGMSQPFGDVSPQTHKELEIDYSLPIAERFAYSYYGCCEPLDRKMDIIKAIPNLRKIGVSPWADEERSAEQIGGRYVYARKPNPANVAIRTDPDWIRAETEKTVKLCIAHGCPLELVLKDISTVSGRPENLIVWANTVADVLDEYYGK
ncbi:MAG: hypothetical protein J6R82_03160 [Clostridia bacterium]|nr:hypothetical protein [Clostridia bacterium]